MQNFFISVTGISHVQEAEWLRQISEQFMPPDGYQFNVGILASEKTLDSAGPSHPRFPAFAELLRILERMQPAFTPVIHYSSGEDTPLSKQISALLEQSRIYQDNLCRWMQINVRTPDPDELAKLKQTFPRLVLILQIPLWQDSFRDSQIIQQFVNRYHPYADYFIIDPSGGRGRDVNKDILNLIKPLIDQGLPLCRLVFAGGLSHDNADERVNTSGRFFSDFRFSIDAERRLRGGKYNGEKIGDQVNPEKAKQYLEKACRAFSELKENH